MACPQRSPRGCRRPSADIHGVGFSGFPNSGSRRALDGRLSDGTNRGVGTPSVLLALVGRRRRSTTAGVSFFKVRQGLRRTRTPLRIRAASLTHSRSSFFTPQASRAILDAIAAGEGALSSVEAEVSERLAQEGFQEGSEVLTKLESLRHRLEALDQDRSELTRLELEIAADREGTRRTLGDASEMRLQLREARKAACARVNDSMRTFFVRLDEDAGVEELDSLLEEAKRGTYQQRQKLAEVRESLNRERLLEVAVGHRQGIDIPPAAEFESQDDIARNAVAPDRSLVDALALIATTWPEDRLVLQTKEPPESFENLTEGMRALAIKEISFAESAIPVITDQPEDAVPPQNVYENLVPTLREQRSERQFILASHDANIVVAGDVEQIHVLRPGDTPVAGTLFDESVRNAAIEILEGGREAFDVRAKRYRGG